MADAGGEVAWPVRLEARLPLPAGVERMGAARRERAADDRPGQVGWQAQNRLEPRLPFADPWDRVEERDRIGVARRAEYVGDPPCLDEAPGIHHPHPLAGLRDDADVVGDEDNAHAEVAAELAEERENLVLDGDVEGGGRLVGEDQLRRADDRCGDSDALALAAGKLVRIGAEAPFRIRDADELHRLDDAAPEFGARDAAHSAEALANLLLDREHRIER